MILGNSQYNIILREYDELQFRNKHRLNQRINEVYSLIPKLKKIDDALVTNSASCAKRALFTDDDLTKELHALNQPLLQLKQELLQANGYPDNYLEPIYSCTDCHDTGFIGTNKCQCFKQKMVDLIFSQDTVKDILTKENFNNFRFSYYSDDVKDRLTGLTPYENILRITNLCKSFITKFDSNYQNLLIYGNTGVGKTFLANCIAHELMQSGHIVIYLTAYQLFSLLEKSKFDKGQETAAEKLNLDLIFDSDLLIIDDLGTEMTNSFISSQLYNCINERHLKHKSTIISTNYSLDEINTTYSERIWSRITGNYTLLNVFGDDIRITKRLNLK